MPIINYQENIRPTILGKIRLGVKTTSAKGAEYPVETEFFVLKDAPEVASVYGAEPTELDIFFISDVVEEAIPYWYKWYGGNKKDAKGNSLGGELYCRGDGEKALYFHKRDGNTGVVPERPCLGEKCPDWAPGGKQQCKAMMTMYVLIPRVSLYGVYQIDTGSKAAINNILSGVSIAHKWGALSKVPFKLYRDPTSMRIPGKDQKKVFHCMNIRPNEEEFNRLYGAQMQQKVLDLHSKSAFGNSTLLLNRETGEIADYVQDTQPVIEAPKVDPAKVISDIANSAELKPLFDTLAKLKKVENVEKNRKALVVKMNNNIESVKKYLDAEILKLTPKIDTNVVDATSTNVPPPQTGSEQMQASDLI